MLELAMTNNVWFEMTVGQGTVERPYMKDNPHQPGPAMSRRRPSPGSAANSTAAAAAAATK